MSDGNRVGEGKEASAEPVAAVAGSEEWGFYLYEEKLDEGASARLAEVLRRYREDPGKHIVLCNEYLVSARRNRVPTTIGDEARLNIYASLMDTLRVQRMMANSVGGKCVV